MTMAYPAQSSSPRIRNQRTQALNRRESFWQITLPLGAAIVIAIALMALVIMGTTAPVRTSALADVSLMFLILMAAVAGVLILALIGGLCVGVWFALRELPYLFKRAQDFAALVAYHAKRVTAPLNDSVLSVGSIVAAVRQAVISLRSIFTSGR
ncbi:MAG: hypothetical protein HW418_3979 [Anaerolineales bacterium]|nr:hypothetical protein [Anaerolineales bacterium]